MNRTLATAAACLMLAGCSAPPAASPVASVSPTATSTESSAAPTPTPSDSTLNLGDTADLAAGAITVQALQLKVMKNSDRDNPAMAALIKMCNVSNPDPIGPSWDPWSLVDAESGQFTASTETYTYDPKPQYPFIVGDRKLNTGDCAKGWVVFEVEKSTKVATIEYDNEAGDHLEWRV
jgi:hypothetical protein